MAENNTAKDDSDKMYFEYVNGTSINELSVKYNHTPEEVEAVVTNVTTESVKKDK